MVNASHYQPRFVELMQVAEKQIIAKQKELDEFKAARSNGKGGRK